MINKNIINLKEDQIIFIENEEFIIINKVKFREKNSFWYEYKLKKIKTNEIFYLNVELNNKSILYKILNTNFIDLKLNITFNNENYSLFEKGNGLVETYIGTTDIGINEEVEYYEYINDNNSNLFLSIENWKDETEISIGKLINLKDIKF